MDNLLPKALRLRSEVLEDGTLVRSMDEAMEFVQQHREHSNQVGSNALVQLFKDATGGIGRASVATAFYSWCKERDLILEELDQHVVNVGNVIQFPGEGRS